MKQFFLSVMIIVATLCVGGVSGSSLTFQNQGDFASSVSCVGTGVCTWAHNTTGGNSYVNVSATGVGYAILINSDPEPTTYAAATLITSLAGPQQTVVDLYDGTFTQIGVLYPGSGTNMRCEVSVASGFASLYCDSKFKGKVAVSSNPSYVGWATESVIPGTAATYVDDIVYGSSENKYIFGMPESGYFIRKDMINPAASGFYYQNGTLASTYNMTTTWGFGSSNASQEVLLKEWSAGSIAYGSNTSSGSQSGSISWPVYDAIINNPSMPYGYYITTVSGSGEVSDVIPYVSYGASVAFDSATYSRGDTATITYLIDSGGYWNTAAYTYKMDILDVYGNVVDSQPVTMQTGSKSYTFSSSSTLGIYYAVLIATPVAGGNEIWMNFDSTELVGYLVMTGKVYNGETGLPIPVSNVSITQGSTAYNKVTAVDGNYTTNAAFYSGSTIYINITSSGYIQYTNSFIPLEGKTIGLNFTLVPSPPTFSGVALGGVVRDNVYGRPIPLADVTAANSTYSQSYTSTANSVGYYQIDDSTGAHLVNGRCYVVSSAKTGYTAVGSYFKCVVGV